jgi:hypothetical protein
MGRVVFGGILGEEGSIEEEEVIRTNHMTHYVI